MILIFLLLKEQSALGGNNNEKNYYLILGLAVGMLICLVTGTFMYLHVFANGPAKIVNKNIHIYVSYLLTIGVLFHLAWNWKWLRGTTKEIFGGKEHK